MTSARRDLVGEDYLVFSITALEDRPTAQALVEQHGDDIVRLLRGEREALSRQECDEVLRHRISYFEHDLRRPHLERRVRLRHRERRAGGAEILEFANSQLLEFRYYDELLDRSWPASTRDLQTPGWFRLVRPPVHARGAAVHALFIDVNELTDRAENALKLAGDIYTARVLDAGRGAAGPRPMERERPGETEDARRYLPVRGRADGNGTGEVLELMIVLILIFELVLFFMGIMR